VALGPEARETIAIEEWMGASPVYTRRMQRAMGFVGDDVSTIFKGLQLDVGFAHQYMDVRYELESERRGFFWLQSCGALLEIEPHGEAAVRSMCHAIEDPTFDATAVATNPRARCRPVHRPPRVPVDRVPHCRWEVTIDPALEPVQEIPLTARVRASRLAALEFAPPREDASGGWRDYSGRFEPDFHLELLSRAALVRVCRELSVQNHLLVRALMTAVADRAGAEMAQKIGLAQWVGAGAVAAQRVARTLGIAGDGAEAIVKVLQLHPAFLPGYTRVRLSLPGDGCARLALEDCDALREADGNGWFALLSDQPNAALDAMVQAVNPRARCVPTAPQGAERLAWQIRLDGEAAALPPEAAMVRATGTSRFAFASHPTPA